MTIDHDPNDTRTFAEYQDAPKGDAGSIFDDEDAVRAAFMEGFEAGWQHIAHGEPAAQEAYDEFAASPKIDPAEYRGADYGDDEELIPIVEIKSGKMTYFECRDCGQALVDVIGHVGDDELVKCKNQACGAIKQYHYTPADKWI